MQMAADGGGGAYPRDLPSGSGESHVNHEVLKDIHRILAADLKELEGSGYGTVRYLQNGEVGNLGPNELGTFPAAAGTSGMDGLTATCSNAYTQIGSVYSTFVTAYGNLVQTLKNSADGHAEAERTNRQTMNNVGQSTSSGGSSNSQFYA
jgi:hypothetical protein